MFEGAKETIGIQHAVAHVFGCQVEKLPAPNLLTDSMAARNVTEMSGLLRRLRHIDIRICFLQDAVYKGVISITFVRGTENCAGLMTLKALSRTVTLQRMEKIGVVRGFLNTLEIPYDWIGRWCWILEKVSCKSLVIVEFCASPKSEMKAEGERLEGVEVLTITEADDGTRTDTIEETREAMLSHKKNGKLVVLCLMVVDSVYRRMSVSVYLSQEVWSGLHESSSRVVSNPKEALERFPTVIRSC